MNWSLEIVKLSWYAGQIAIGDHMCYRIKLGLFEIDYLLSLS